MATSDAKPLATRLAGQIAGADAVEVKFTIPTRQIDKTLRLFGLAAAGAEKRGITFYDTLDLKSFARGLILRSRRVVGRDDDSTVKFRPVEERQVPAKWRRRDGFKIEADANGAKIVRSASLTRKLPKGMLKSVAAGTLPSAALFDKDQTRFILELSGQACEFGDVVALGPLEALVWKVAHPGLPEIWPLTVELWTRPDGARMLEASIRAPIAQAAAAMGGFAALLAELGVTPTPADGAIAKTKWALDYFAKRGSRPAARRR